MLCPRRELTKKGRDVAEASNGENLCGSSDAVKRKRDRSGEGGCKRELSRNMERLVHCLVGSWNPSSGKLGEILEFEG